MDGYEVIVVFNKSSLDTQSHYQVLSSSEEIQATLRRFGASIKPLFNTQPEIFDDPQGAAELRDIVADQSRYFSVSVARESAGDLIAQLQAMLGVEAAYIKPPVENPLGPPEGHSTLLVPAPFAPVPDFTSRQGYLDPAPDGVDARFAWKYPGGRGTDVNIIDIEGAWQFSHVDLLQHQGGLVGGTPYPGVDWRNHGTAVFGEIGGDDNHFGVIGIAPDANTSAISHGGLGSAGAIQLAAQKLRPGDIMLLEMHRPGPRYNYQTQSSQLGYIAVEWWPDDLLAIRYATAKGVIVVEAAGNGAENLDDALYDRPGPGFPASWRNPFRGGVQDSGAVIVGAGADPSGAYGPDRSRLGFSNYSSRLDCQGWGRSVTTTGYGDLYRDPSNTGNENFWYTGFFSGTSSASPIVVGAVACLQGVAKQRGAALSPQQMRNALRTSGSPQQGNTAERIGTRPDLRQLIGRKLIAAGIHQTQPAVIGDDIGQHNLEEMPSAPRAARLAEMFSVQEGEDKPAPDFLGALHTQAIPPKTITRVTAEPKLPVMNVQWYWNSPGYSVLSVHHKAYILYNEHGRNDQSRVLQFTNNSLLSVLDFGGDVLGGALICRCSITWRRNSDGQTGTTPEGEQQFGILGDNPSKATVRGTISSLQLQVIAYKESRFRQFDNAALPLFGSPKGFGVMQLDTPRPSARQLWHWKDNVQGGISLHAQKEREVNQHFQNIYQAHPEAPKLTAEQVKLSLYQYYNGGWYWEWDVAAKIWKAYGTTSYGDDALRVEKLVAAGTPPPDWN